ncbi:MAG: hypothetical protein AB8B72_06600 [Crocinitomicaceae bacterium]
MSKEYKNIDELFKSTIGNGNAIAPKSVKKGVLASTGGGNWWLVGAALLLLTAVGAIALTNSMSSNTALTNYQPRENEPQLEFKNYNAIVESNSQPDNSRAKVLAGKTKIETSKIGIELESQMNYSSLLSPRNHVNSNNLHNNSISSNEFEANLNDQTIHVNDNLKTEGSATAENRNSIAAAEKDSTSTDFAANDVNSSVEVNPQPEFKSSKPKTDLEIINTVEQPIPSADLNENLSVVHENKSIDNPDQELVDTANNNSSTVYNSSAVKIEENPKSRKGYWMIDANIGPNINTAKYGNTEFGQSLNKFHGEKLGFQGQLTGKYVTASNITASMGFGYESQSYNTTFLTTSEIFEYETNSVFSNYVYDSTNAIIDSVYIMQDTIISVTSLVNHSGISSQQYYQIPIRLGYQIEKNKWIFGADLGAQINFLVKSKGSYLLNNEVINHNEGTILKRTTFNYTVGATAQYNVFNNFYMSGQVRFSPAVQNYYQKTYGLRSINSVSLGIGVSLKL